MHPFSDLIMRSGNFSRSQINASEEETISALDTSASTNLVKNLQMLNLQRTIVVVGLFSILESFLQSKLFTGEELEGGAKEKRNLYAFSKARSIIEETGNVDLVQRFDILKLSVNTLKHGIGRAHSQLIKMEASFPFRIKEAYSDFVDEGDVGEIYHLIEVNDGFLEFCTKTVSDILQCISIALGDPSI